MPSLTIWPTLPRQQFFFLATRGTHCLGNTASQPSAAYTFMAQGIKGVDAHMEAHLGYLRCCSKHVFEHESDTSYIELW